MFGINILKIIPRNLRFPRIVLLINFPLKHFHGNEWESKIPVKGGSFVIIMFLILVNILDIPDIFITFPKNMIPGDEKRFCIPNAP